MQLPGCHKDVSRPKKQVATRRLGMVFSPGLKPWIERRSQHSVLAKPFETASVNRKLLHVY